jgi:ABC-type glycerol-3-phosphate transport system permease component
MNEYSGLAKAARWLGFGLLGLVVVVVDFPVIVVVFNAFKSAADISSNSLLPSDPLTVDNFRRLGDASFGTFVWNSFIVSAGGTLIALVGAVTGGYALSRFRQRGLGAYSGFLLAIQMIPIVVTLLPLFVIVKNLGLLDTHLGLILIYGSFLMPFAMLIARSFFDTIPADLEEAAWIDGCSRLQTLVRVVAPLAAPGLVSITVICFISAWNEYLLASVFLTSSELLTVGVGLQLFSQQNITEWGPVMAGSTVAMIPSLLVYLAFQRYFVSGALAGAVKG